ncbi:MAG: UbiA family prenyltransferase [Pseudomonadota bacterium]
MEAVQWGGAATLPEDVGETRGRASERFAALGPLYVDLNNSLIGTDLLLENALGILRYEPQALVAAAFDLGRGRQALKMRLAEKSTVDVTTLPYREAVLKEIRQARADGRPVVLATGAPLATAERVAAHLRLFDGVLASSEAVNLVGEAKRDAIVADAARRRRTAGLTGETFGYIGDARVDRPIFEAAAKGQAIAPGGAIPQALAAHAEPLAVPARTAKSAIKALRPHQWTKNVFVFTPLVLSHGFPALEAIFASVLAFIAFSAIASATYIFNDLLDLRIDRSHRSKRFRPLAAGKVSIPTALWLATGVFAFGVGVALTLPLLFQALLGIYVLSTLAYSLALKRMLMIDVITLAGLHTLRILAGSAAAEIDVSFWLLSFSLFLFLSLALVKRYMELVHIGDRAGRKRTGRGYREADLETIALGGMCSAFSAVLVLALYINSDITLATVAHPWVLWPICPLILYVLMRIWILARRKEMDDDPVAFALTDWRSQIMFALSGIIYLAAPHV